MNFDISIHKLQKSSVFEHYFTKQQFIDLMQAFLMLKIVSSEVVAPLKKYNSFFLNSSQTKFFIFFMHNTKFRAG
jgi:hypothetical protein